MNTNLSISSLMIEELNNLNMSPDNQVIYGYKDISNIDIVMKINEIIDKFNKLVEVIDNER